MVVAPTLLSARETIVQPLEAGVSPLPVPRGHECPLSGRGAESRPASRSKGNRRSPRVLSPGQECPGHRDVCGRTALSPTRVERAGRIAMRRHATWYASGAASTSPRMVVAPTLLSARGTPATPRTGMSALLYISGMLGDVWQGWTCVSAPSPTRETGQPLGAAPTPPPPQIWCFASTSSRPFNSCRASSNSVTIRRRDSSS